MSKGLRIIACLKVVRGSLTIAVGCSIIVTYQSFDALIWAEHPILTTFSSKDLFLRKLIDWMFAFPKQQVLALGLLAISLGALRYIEAIGIFNNRSWAKLTAVVQALILLGFLINELGLRFNWGVLIMALANVLTLGYLLYNLHQNMRSTPDILV